MITVHNEGVFLRAGVPCSSAPVSPEEGRQETMAYRILQSHNLRRPRSSEDPL